jgi:hypothetical protein
MCSEFNIDYPNLIGVAFTHPEGFFQTTVVGYILPLSVYTIKL